MSRDLSASDNLDNRKRSLQELAVPSVLLGFFYIRCSTMLFFYLHTLAT